MHFRNSNSVEDGLERDEAGRRENNLMGYCGSKWEMEEDLSSAKRCWARQVERQRGRQDIGSFSGSKGEKGG